MYSKPIQDISVHDPHITFEALKQNKKSDI